MKAFTLLFLAHCLGDYYFQPQCLAERKSRGLGWVLLHSAIYAAAMGLSLMLLGGGYLWAVVICACTHCIIDVIKQIILNNSAKQGVLTVRADRTAFCVDQALHLIIMLAAAAYVTEAFELIEPPYLLHAGHALGGRFGGDAYVLIAYAAMLLAAAKPANVFIKKMLATEKPNDPTAEAPYRVNKRTGQLIGSLERILILMLLVLGQYASVAIVFTAKSIARFRQLEDREFAEYYITGTLLSAVTACMIFGLLRVFGTL